MIARFWGTRGSIPRPNVNMLRYGGNTSCLEIRTASGQLIVIDCGTGGHDLGHALASDPRQPVKGAMLISHAHWDHIQGVPFFAPFFVPGNEWDIYAPRGLNQSFRETLAGQMQYEYFPITLDAFAATVRYHDLVEGVFEIGDATISTHYLNHPALTLGFRIEADGATLVYANDHESASRHATPNKDDLGGLEHEHVAFLQNADLVIHDAQYTAEEYPKHVGWGHSTAEYAVEVCKAADVKRLMLSHHDPDRQDAAIDAMVDNLRTKLHADGSMLELDAAAEGDAIELAGGSKTISTSEISRFRATENVTDAIVAHRLLLGDMRPEVAEIVHQAAAAEELTTVPATSALDMGSSEDPMQSLFILDYEAAPEQVTALKGALGDADGSSKYHIPALIVADEEGTDDEPARSFADTLIWPFTKEFAQSRLRAAILRERCRWIRARRPNDEAERLAELYRLNVLDTAPEERFDRLTRIACNAFGVPIALVSLVDDERQWFKSRAGLEASETSREVSFCAHAILEEEPLIVEDTLLDERFADNPLVRGGPHIRFYAGYPLHTKAGTALGSLCLIDSRPHRFDNRKIGMLADLAQLVITELGRKP